MKKISTMLALSCLMLASSASAGIAPKMGDFSKEIVTTSAQRQQLRTMRANAEYDAIHQTNQDKYDTRTWVDPRTGNTWTMQFNKEQAPLCELIGFQDDQGNPFQYTFEQLPLYCVTYVLWVQDKTTQDVISNVSLQLCWPSYYVWSQAFTWDGELDEDDDIPLEKRDYRCVTPSDMFNSTVWCHRFRESMGIGGQMTADGNNWLYFTMLPNQALGFQGMVDGELGYTTIGESRSSELTLNGYDEATNTVSYDQVIYFTAESGNSKILRGSPDGVARVEGFVPRNDNLPEFGDVHLFNMGIGSSDTNFDYPNTWGPLSQLYFVAADKYISIVVPEDMKILDMTKIQTVMSELPEGEDFDAHANFLKGVVYAEPKFSNDTQLDPKGMRYDLLFPTLEWDPEWETDYFDITPVANSFVAYGVGLDSMEGWSENYGVQLRVRNFANYFGNAASMAFGTEKGYEFTCDDYYGNLVYAYSTGDCVYHYDANDVQKTRKFKLSGNLEYDSVETVVADNATVSAADGVIAVSVAEDSNVAVYSLAGATLKAANVKAGNALNVAADKGIYVVVVNGKSVKVAL